MQPAPRTKFDQTTIGFRNHIMFYLDNAINIFFLVEAADLDVLRNLQYKEARLK